MKNISDDRLEKMLAEYCEAPCEASFAVDPERVSAKSNTPKRYYRQLAAAAAFVLITALSLTLYFLIGNKGQAPIAAAPTPPSTTIAPTDNIVENPRPTESVAPTDPTQKPTVAPTQKPTVTPTQNSTQSVSAPVTPTESPAAPTQQPTSAPIAPATTAPTQPTTEPPAPTTAPTVAPTTVPDKPADLSAVGYDGVIIDKVLSDEVGESPIYCRIYTEDGELIGGDDPYSDEHIALRFDDDAEIMVYYIPCDCLTLPYSGTYCYEFYDDTGRTLCSGSEFLIP